jgi:hypothetical protein
MEHKKEIIEGENIFETGIKTSYLRYDSLELFLDGTAEGLESQAIKDKEKNRVKLAELGIRAATLIRETAEITNEMWRISEAHMKKD